MLRRLGELCTVGRVQTPTLALVALAATHMYFALRPEKIFYTRSMITGWISEEELAANHDTTRWSPKEAD